jgi:hypothetical protein
LIWTDGSRSKLDIESDGPELTPSESYEEPINVFGLINQSIHISQEILHLSGEEK